MKRWWLVLALAVPVFARDNLDSTRGHGWSPNSQWLAFNPVNQDDLFIVSLDGHRNFRLKPVGEVVLDTANVFATQNSPTNTAADHQTVGSVTVSVGSPGRSKLEALVWSPDSDTLAYRCARDQRVTFSVLDHTVTGVYSLTNALPWLKPDDWQVTFEFEHSTTNHPSRYLLRVVRPDNSVIKKVTFENPREVQRISLLRSTQSTFLTPDHQTLIYPHVVSNQWELATQPVTGVAGPRPLTEPAPGAPYEWRLSPDGKTLAIVEGSTAIAIGPLADWKQAERVTFSNATMSVAWSPDSRYLAANDRQNLYLIEVAKDTGKLVGGMTQVFTSCSGQFWGWRGSRLIFNDSSGPPADLSFIDTATPDRRVQLLVKSQSWRSAPVVHTISPDGKTYVCLFMEINGEGRLVYEIWKTNLEPGADWELLHRWFPATAD